MKLVNSQATENGIWQMLQPGCRWGGYWQAVQREKRHHYCSRSTLFSSILLKLCCRCYKWESEILRNTVNRSNFLRNNLEWPPQLLNLYWILKLDTDIVLIRSNICLQKVFLAYCIHAPCECALVCLFIVLCFLTTNIGRFH